MLALITTKEIFKKLPSPPIILIQKSLFKDLKSNNLSFESDYISCFISFGERQEDVPTWNDATNSYENKLTRNQTITISPVVRMPNYPYMYYIKANDTLNAQRDDEQLIFSHRNFTIVRPFKKHLENLLFSLESQRNDEGDYCALFENTFSLFRHSLQISKKPYKQEILPELYKGFERGEKILNRAKGTEFAGEEAVSRKMLFKETEKLINLIQGK